MTDLSLIPADVVRAVPEGAVVFGMQLPIQSQSTLYVADWEKDVGARRAGPHRPRGRRRRLLLHRRVRPHRHPPPPGRRHGHHLVRHDGHPGLVGRADDADPPALARADPGPAPSACAPPRSSRPSTCSRAAASSSAWAPATCPRSTSSSPATSTQRGRHTDEAVSALARCFTDEFPELPGPRFPARDMGLAPRPARVAAPAHLDRWLLAGRHPAHRGLRRRLAAPGHAPARPARSDRPAPRAARRAAGRCAARHRHHRRAHLPDARAARAGTCRAG